MDARVEQTPDAGGGGARPRMGVLLGASTLPILVAASISHGLNDLMQSLLPALYPVLQQNYRLDYGQVGLITLAFQITASLLQPLIGLSTDRKARPYSLPFGMGATLLGLLLLSNAASFRALLFAAALVGLGSAIFHPEASRVARLASGGRHGLAQSVFQVGGSIGAATGPLLAASIVVPFGQRSIAWFSFVALIGMVLLTFVGRWYAARLRAPRPAAPGWARHATISRARIVGTVLTLLGLIFSKYFYLAAMSTFYTFYLIQKFGVSIQTAQELLFVFLGAVAIGTLAGGALSDRVGRKVVIWVSILGVLPFTLLLPHAGLVGTCVLSIVIGVILSSAFSAIVVYAQELIPGKVGLVGGLFFGFAFGMGGLGAALLGVLADHTSIEFVFEVCAFLPALGVLTFLLPDIESRKA